MAIGYDPETGLEYEFDGHETRIAAAAARRAEVIRMTNAGHTTVEIMAALHISHRQVYRLRSEVQGKNYSAKERRRRSEAKALADA